MIPNSTDHDAEQVERESSALDWLPQTRFFRNQSGDLVIEQQQPGGDVVAVIVPAINLPTFLEDVSDVCGIPSYPMKWEWGENPTPGEPCPDGSYVGHFTAGIEVKRVERPAPETETPQPSRSSAAERQRRYRERKRNARTTDAPIPDHENGPPTATRNLAPVSTFVSKRHAASQTRERTARHVATEPRRGPTRKAG